MDVKVNVDGVEAVVTVGNADEVVALLSTIAQRGLSTHVSSENSVQTLTSLSGTLENPELEGQVRKALMRTKGKQSAKVLGVINKHGSSGCTDIEIREEVGMEPTANLGPVFSTIAKACKRAGFDKGVLFRRQEGRGPGRQVRYKYTITNLASRLSGEIDKFEDEEAEFEPDF